LVARPKILREIFNRGREGKGEKKGGFIFRGTHFWELSNREGPKRGKEKGKSLRNQKGLLPLANCLPLWPGKGKEERGGKKIYILSVGGCE